jgi:hypothetical protein
VITLATPTPIQIKIAQDILFFHNKLGNNTEVENSIVGPDGTVVLTPNYPPGKFDNGISSPYVQLYRATFPIVEMPEEGAIATWYTPLFNSGAAPGAYARVWAVNTSAGIMQLVYEDSTNRFGVFFPGNGLITFDSVNFVAGEDLHLALTYKNGGVPGYGTSRFILKINDVRKNIQVGGDTNNFSTPLTVIGTFAVANESDGVSDRGSEGACDNLKMYSNPKTDWSDRNIE